MALAEDEDAAGEFVLAVRTKRSAKQLAVGQRGGIFTVLTPAPVTTASKQERACKELHRLLEADMTMLDRMSAVGSRGAGAWTTREETA